MLKQSKYIGLLFPLLLSGCLFSGGNLSNLNVPGVNVNVSDTKVADPRGVVAKVKSALVGQSQDDIKHIAAMYLGASNYLAHAKNIPTTVDVVTLFKNVNLDYGWEAGRCKELTDFVESDLKSLGLNKPTKIDDVKRAELVQAFALYGEGCLQSIK